MALKNLFDMVKADRYTADGREEIIKAQEAETEDATRRTYQIGEISQSTGLQKTANGWVKPKNGKQPGAKKQEKKGAGIPQATTETFVGKTYKDFVESATPSGYKPTKNTDNPDGSSTTVFEKEGKQIKVEFDKNGKITKVTPGENKSAAENKTTIRQGPNTKTLNETPAEHVQKNLDAYKGYSDYDMEELVLEPSGYKRSTGENLRGGREVITYTKNGAKDISLYFDKNGELEDVYIARGEPFDSAPRQLTGDTRIRVRKA